MTDESQTYQHQDPIHELPYAVVEQQSSSRLNTLAKYAAATLAVVTLSLGMWSSEMATAATQRITSNLVTAPSGVEPPIVYKASGPAKGIVMAIHGGAWLYAGTNYGGAAEQKAIEPDAIRLANAGYDVISVDYGQGKNALPDVESQYRQVVAKDGRPVCVFGESAGGNLALLAARDNPAIKCVISEAGITNIPALERSQAPGAKGLYEAAVKFFGKAGLLKMSPALQPWTKKTPLLLSGASNDPFVPYSQVGEMSWGQKKSLTSGDVQWVHSKVNAAKLKALQASELTFLKQNISKR